MSRMYKTVDKLEIDVSLKYLKINIINKKNEKPTWYFLIKRLKYNFCFLKKVHVIFLWGYKTSVNVVRK